MPVTRTSVIVATATASWMTPGERHEAEGEKDGVPPDLRRARHCRASLPREVIPPACAARSDHAQPRYDGPNVTGSSGKPG